MNQLYGILDEVGSWNGSWQNICSSIYDLADLSNQADCITEQDRIENCTLSDGERVVGVWQEMSNNTGVFVFGGF